MSDQERDMGTRAHTGAQEDVVTAPELPGLGVRSWQEQLVANLLRAVSIVGLPVAAAGTYDSYVNQEFWTIPFYWGFYGIVVLLTLWRQAPYALRASAIMALIYVLGCIDFVQDGRSGSARVFMLAVPFLAGLFLQMRRSVAALVLVTLTMAGFGWAFSAGALAAEGDPASADPTGWVAGTLTFFLMGLLIVVSLNYLMPRLAAAIEGGQRLARALEAQRDHLEDEVVARTRDLMRQGARLEAAARVARDAAAIQDVGELLEETVRLISTRFDFYHTGIFLLDEAKEYAVLRAASSEGGQRMLARGHRLRVAETGARGAAGSPAGLPVGIVGYVTRQGQPRIALDVGADAAYFDNPDLPETRSEVALPLRARGEIIGALDVQSVEPEAFTEEDVEVLQTLADQVAVAISNARLFRRAEESLKAERRAYGEISREAWQQLVGRRAERGFRCDTQGIVPLGAGLSMTGAGSLQSNKPRAAMDGQVVVEKEGAIPTVSVPIPIRDQVVGVLNFRKENVGEIWSEEELALLRTMAGQLGQALESARLYQDSQRRAAEEQLLGEVTARVRETLDVDAVLQTAIREMGAALGLSRVEVRMGEGGLVPKTGTGVEEGGEHVGAD